MTANLTIIHLCGAVTLFMLDKIILIIIHFVTHNWIHVEVIVVVELTYISIIYAALRTGFLPFLWLI